MGAQDVMGGATRGVVPAIITLVRMLTHAIERIRMERLLSKFP